MSKLLSIVTVTYNAEKSLENTILSVLRNKNDEIEYIIIDGKSTDGTEGILSKYKNDIDIIISESDEGVYDALNKGFRRATGLYVMLLAADDELIDGAIPKAMESINANTDVWCGAIIEKRSYGYFLEKSDRDLSKLKYQCSLRNPATIFRKAIFEKYGYYDQQYKCSGDREMFLRLYLNNAVFQIEDIPIVVFSQGGISTRNRLEYAIPEGVQITKRYGFYDEHEDQRIKKVTKREKRKGVLGKNNLLGYLEKYFYSPVLYTCFCKVTGREYNRLSKEQIKQIINN